MGDALIKVFELPLNVVNRQASAIDASAAMNKNRFRERLVDEWLAWADAYINQRGLEGFFDKWRLSDAGAAPDAKSRR